MRKNDIAEHIVSTTTLSRSQAIQAIDSAFEAIGNSLCKGESVYVRGFATFRSVLSKQKKARNINKGTTIIVPEKRSAKLIICKQLKDQMNKEG